MEYEAIREARLRRPYRPFFLKTTDGRVFFVREAEHMAVAPRVVIVFDELQDAQVMLSPAEVDVLLYTDQTLGTTDGRH